MVWLSQLTDNSAPRYETEDRFEAFLVAGLVLVLLARTLDSTALSVLP